MKNKFYEQLSFAVIAFFNNNTEKNDKNFRSKSGRLMEKISEAVADKGKSVRSVRQITFQKSNLHKIVPRNFYKNS